MSLDLICWAILWVLVSILVAGTYWLLTHNQPRSAEGERAAAEADDEVRRFLSGTDR